MTYFLHGAYAYDTVMLHPGQFAQRILPKALNKLNVSFNVNGVHEHFGGTAGNIAYNASVLNHALGGLPGFKEVWPHLLGTIGAHDGARYLEHLQKQGHETDTLTSVPGAGCAHAWLLTDKDGNQLTSFSAGCSTARIELPPTSSADLWHLSPAPPAEMMRLARHVMASGAQLYFDPGQTLPALLAQDAAGFALLCEVLAYATGIFVNAYEAQLLEDVFGEPVAFFVKGPGQFAIRTLGEKGAELSTQDGTVAIAPGVAQEVQDPTGCGDAFRAGFLFGVLNGKSLEQAARLGIAMATLAVESEGGQSHAAPVERLLHALS